MVPFDARLSTLPSVRVSEAVPVVRREVMRWDAALLVQATCLQLHPWSGSRASSALPTRMPAAGDSHSVLLRSDGRAVAFGDNQCGQCDVPPLEPGVRFACDGPATWPCYESGMRF